MTMDEPPILPPELEEIIFSLAAQSNLKGCVDLLLVAKRVYEWLKPQLFKIAIIHEKSGHGQPRFNSSLLEAHGRHIRHILLWSINSQDACRDIAECLSWCPNVVNIALWGVHTIYDERLINILLGLSFTHLSFDISRFHFHLGKYYVTTPVSFASVTHVYLIGAEVDFPSFKVKEYLPSITHIALDERRKLSIHAILDNWKDQLKVLVWYVNQLVLPYHVPEDPRLVLVLQSMEFIRDWKEVAEDGKGSIWRIAETEVRRRRETPGLDWKEVIIVPEQ